MHLYVQWWVCGGAIVCTALILVLPGASSGWLSLVWAALTDMALVYEEGEAAAIMEA